MYFSQIRVDPDRTTRSSSSAAIPARCRSMAARRGRASPVRTPTTTPSGSIPRIRGSCSSATMAASTSATTAGRPGTITTTSRSGQFYQVSADMRRPYYVCGGLQDNNAWCGPSALRSATGPVNTDWFTVAGGDGFYTRQDPTDWAIVYARIAGRQHEPARSARRHAEEHPAERRRRTRRPGCSDSGHGTRRSPRRTCRLRERRGRRRSSRQPRRGRAVVAASAADAAALPT